MNYKIACNINTRFYLIYTRFYLINTRFYLIYTHFYLIYAHFTEFIPNNTFHFIALLSD